MASNFPGTNQLVQLLGPFHALFSLKRIRDPRAIIDQVANTICVDVRITRISMAGLHAKLRLLWVGNPWTVIEEVRDTVFIIIVVACVATVEQSIRI